MTEDQGVAASRWREAPGLPGYLVTQDGRVIGKSGEALTGQIDTRGYRRVHISAASGFRKVRVHRLVCEAFHGPPQPGMEVCHIDGNHLNNAASNLMWGSRSLNVRQAIDHGTHRNAQRSQANGNRT